MAERSVQRARWHCTSPSWLGEECAVVVCCCFLMSLPVGHRSEGADLLSSHHTVLCASFKDLNPRRRAIPLIFNVGIPTLKWCVSGDCFVLFRQSCCPV